MPTSSVPPLAVNPSVPNAINVVFFTPYERKGVIVMAVAGVLSCTFVSSLLLYIIFTAVSPWPKPTPGAPAPFTRKQIAVFVICLLVSDMMQSISGIIQVKWAIDNSIYEGAACTTQAATLVIGDLGSTVWSCVIAAHTFSSLALGKQWPRWAVWATVVTGWSLLIVLAAIGPAALTTVDKGPFYGIAGSWCFIVSEYAIPRLGIHYVPMFIAGVTILVFYGLVFLVLRGRLNFSPQQRISRVRMDDVISRERVVIAKRMLWYPVAYLTCMMPIAILRLVGLRKKDIPDNVWIFGMFFLFLLGAVDSVIYATTRRMIKPLRVPTHLRTFSDNSSDRTVVSSPIKASMHERKDVYRYMDTETFRADQELESKGSKPSSGSGSGSRSGSEAETYQETRPGVIRVTLERIQEII